MNALDWSDLQGLSRLKAGKDWLVEITKTSGRDLVPLVKPIGASD